MKDGPNCTRFITNLCLSQNHFENGTKWKVNNDAEATEAVLAYLNLDYRPSCLDFRSSVDEPLDKGLALSVAC